MRKASDGKQAPVVDEVSVPRAGNGELVIRMAACGVCGTDVEKIRGEYVTSAGILGHEAVGTITDVGSGVSDYSVGNRAFPHHHVSCGVCYFCRNGSKTMCLDYRKSNIFPGGFSEYIRVPAWNVERGGVLILPGNIDFIEATMIEPLACCIRALNKCPLPTGGTALVVGAGPVGLAHSLVLASRGGRVMLSDISQARLEFARRLEIGETLDARSDVPSIVKKSTEGRGVDLAVVAAGSPSAILQGVRSVRRGGTVCLFGIPPEGTRLEEDISEVYGSEISIVPSYGATEQETKEALEFISRRPAEFRSLVTRTFPIDEFLAAVEASVGGNEMKVAVTPSQGQA